MSVFFRREDWGQRRGVKRNCPGPFPKAGFRLSVPVSAPFSVAGFDGAVVLRAVGTRIRLAMFFGPFLFFFVLFLGGFVQELENRGKAKGSKGGKRGRIGGKGDQRELVWES
jgi:hypothetical protein